MQSEQDLMSGSICTAGTTIGLRRTIDPNTARNVIDEEGVTAPLSSLSSTTTSTSTGSPESLSTMSSSPSIQRPDEIRIRLRGDFAFTFIVLSMLVLAIISANGGMNHIQHLERSHWKSQSQELYQSTNINSVDGLEHHLASSHRATQLFH